VALRVGQHRDAQPVPFAQDGIGVDVDLVEGDAAARELRRQLLAQMTTAPPVQAQRLSPFQ
jgi:hypothetical protein